MTTTTPAKLGNKNKAYCAFCGSTVGQQSDSTGREVTAVYDCPKCMRNYCDQCSYRKEVGDRKVQLCLRCDSEIVKVM